MPELIDRQSALSVCKEYGWIDDEDFIEGYNTAIKDISEAIKELPTIKPEVRRGRWETWGYVFHGIEWKRCSRCGKCADVSYYGLLDGEIKMSTPATCGGCGARMDGGADNAKD